jgi:hypothetical protein
MEQRAAVLRSRMEAIDACTTQAELDAMDLT